MQKPRLSFWQIWNMSFGFLGIQFGWGLQLANMSPIYKYLHAEESQLPYLWLAGPITGLLIQPVIGSMSDRTWNRLGRRRPYFLVGAILASIAAAQTRFGIDYIPGAADLGDFVATSTTIALAPRGRQPHLPPAVYALFAHPGSSWDSPLEGAAFGDAILPGAQDVDLRQLPMPALASIPAVPDPPAIGSNNFAVSGDATRDGRAIVGNDMHLALRAPNTPDGKE